MSPAMSGCSRAVCHPPLISRANALGRPADQLAVIARLFVSPRARGKGAGRLLLETATTEALSRGLWPVPRAVSRRARGKLTKHARAGSTTSTQLRSLGLLHSISPEGNGQCLIGALHPDGDDYLVTDG
jgi:GNAT superfamily N-acetyltransferase